MNYPSIWFTKELPYTLTPLDVNIFNLSFGYLGLVWRTVVLNQPYHFKNKKVELRKL